MDFEKSFSDFIDCREYEDTENALFSLVRTAFKEGWRAAGGDAIDEQKIIDAYYPLKKALWGAERDSKTKSTESVE